MRVERLGFVDECSLIQKAWQEFLASPSRAGILYRIDSAYLQWLGPGPDGLNLSGMWYLNVPGRMHSRHCK